VRYFAFSRMAISKSSHYHRTRLMGEAERQRDQLAAGWNAIERDPARRRRLPAWRCAANPAHRVRGLLGASFFCRIDSRKPSGRSARCSRRRAPRGRLPPRHCHLAVGDPKTASAVLEQVVREFPQMVQAHNLLGISLAQQSRHREALAHFAFAMERSPRDAEAHNNMGNALSELGRYERRSPISRRRQSSLPTIPRAPRNNLGNALFKLHRSDEAIATYRKAIDLAPDYAKAHSNLGAALVERNRYEEAVASCHKALAIDPNHANAHINLGLAYHGLYRFDEAIVCYQKALAIAPNRPRRIRTSASLNKGKRAWRKRLLLIAGRSPSNPVWPTRTSTWLYSPESQAS